MLKILKKREKLALYLTIGVVAFSLIFNFFLSPILSRYELLNQEITALRVKLIKYKQLIAQKENIEKIAAKFTSSELASGQRQDKFIALLSELESLAKDAEIRIIDIRPQGPGAGATAKEITADLRAEGGMQEYLKFIYNIENSISLLKIKKFQLNAKSSAQHLEGNFSISQLLVSD